MPSTARLLLVLRLVLAVAAFTVVGFLVASSPYLYCLARERSWLAAKDEAELDRRMVAFYRKQVILPEQSAWGRGYGLQPGERMVRYWVLYCEPLDVVFDQQSWMVAAFTTYE